MKTKKFKGMTLIEVIVAIAVLGIAGLVMARMGSVISATMLNTNHVNNKINVEAPVVNTKDDGALKDGSGNYIAEKDLNGEDTEFDMDISVGTSGAYGTYATKRYSTAGLANNADTRTNTNLQGDLEFYQVGERK
ncbi:MAG: type II secretion system protein [Oscillospiraceae bacterium]|nr:type II secretion system protein [Oscillospiraceae bacterium]